MDNKKGLNFFLLVIAIITGSKVYKDIDFTNLRFKNLAIDIIFLLTFIASVFFLVKDFIKKPKA